MSNATRWNSWFLMVNDLLNLREPVDLYVNMCRSSKNMDKKDKKRLEDCVLQDEDWEELIQIHAILYDFWELTLRMQGNVARKVKSEAKLYDMDDKIYDKPGKDLLGATTSQAATSNASEDGALFNVLPAYEHILTKLEEAKAKYIEDTRFGTCINLAWSKMDNYYKKTETSKAYLVAAVLDPRVKLKYFERNWAPEWLTDARENLDAHTELLIQALKLETCNGCIEQADKEMHDSQESNTTFGSW